MFLVTLASPGLSPSLDECVPPYHGMLRSSDQVTIKGSTITTVDGDLSNVNITASYRRSQKHHRNQYTTNNHGSRNSTYNNLYSVKREATGIYLDGAIDETSSDEEPRKGNRSKGIHYGKLAARDGTRTVAAKTEGMQPPKNRKNHHLSKTSLSAERNHAAQSKSLSCYVDSSPVSSSTGAEMQRPHISHVPRSDPVPDGSMPYTTYPVCVNSAPPTSRSTNPFDEVYGENIVDRQWHNQQPEPSRNPFHKYANSV
ncbi:hypothetical protein PM082_012348 [Marasmius tenuissimus]|nr:hypothetical protein PM082_012348 [Marasmius tenuissimus]